MGKGLDLYKVFIDGLVERSEGVLGKWILEKGYPATDENKEINNFLTSLTDSQKTILVKMVQDARTGGIHDTLAYMNEKMDCDNLVISQAGEPFPYDYFDSMNYDFISRNAGDAWPE